MAHYLTYLVEVGQQTLIQASDPLVQRQQLFGTADWSVNYWLSYHPTAWRRPRCSRSCSGTCSAWSRPTTARSTLLPERHRMTGQLPLLFAMVAFTVGGLYLLFAA